MQISSLLAESLCARLGCDLSFAASVLADLGLILPPGENCPQTGPEATMQVTRASSLMDRNSSLGLHAAERTPPRSMGLLGCLALQCESLHEALAELVDLTPLLIESGRMRLQARGEFSVVTLELSLQSARLERIVTEYTFTLLTRVARDYLSGETGLARVSFSHEEGDVPEHARVFACPIVWEAPRSELLFHTRAIVCKRPFFDERLFRLLKEAAQTELAQRTASVPMHRRVSLLLRKDSSLWAGGHDALGRLLGMSSRRLRRRLASEGHSLSALVEEARRKRASCLLIETANPIKHIAEDLGYSEASAFHRAFKRWTGETPVAFRRARLNPQAA